MNRLAFAPRTSPPAPLPPARLTGRGVALAAAAWAAYAVVYALAVTAFADVPFRYSLTSQLSSAVLMGVLSVPVWWTVVRGMAERPLAHVIAAHVLGGALYTTAVTGALLAWTRLGGAESFEAVRAQVGWIALGIAIAYVAQFAIYHAVEASRRGRLRQARGEALQRLAREQELRTLHAQLNPHFLFNALNTVSAQVGRDPYQARETIGRLADLMRYALDAGHRDLVPLADEVAFVRAYLALEHARMGDRLVSHVDVDPSLLDTPVPPMAIQTLVENAVRHAVAPSPGGGEVRVEVVRDGDGARVTVADSGADGGESAPGTGVGLANTDERLRLVFGPSAALDVDRRAEGWRVAFRLPAPSPEPVAA